MNSAVWLHRSSLEVRISNTREVYQAPKLGAQFGCSLKASGATIHDTCGSVPLATSAARMSKKVCVGSPATLVPVRAPSYSGEPGSAFWYWWKYSSELSP